MGSKKTAVVTGASSGIGKAIALMLAEEGYEVIGIGRNFREESKGVKTLVADLTDETVLLDTVKQIKQMAGKVSLLVNCAGVAYYGLHELLGAAKIREMVRLNIELPMILTEEFLPAIREQQGTIVNVSSVTAMAASPHAAAYGATKAALSHFSDSIFAEERKHGVRVINIEPDLTETNLYRNADFTTSDDPSACLNPADVAEALRSALHTRPGTCIRNIRLSPQKNIINRKQNTF